MRHELALQSESSAVLAARPENTRRVRLSGVSKVYGRGRHLAPVLEDISFELRPGEKLAVLGRNGAGKSTLVKLIGGVERPTAGTLEVGLSMSWPLTFGGGFEPEMNGLDNIRLIARIYDRPIAETIAFVDDFAELGRHLREPIRTYSSGMRARLAFALTLAVDFECFLIDEIVAVGDRRFQRKCHDALMVERRGAAMILVSHGWEIVRDFCDRALVLKNGRGRVFSDLRLAYDIYASL